MFSNFGTWDVIRRYGHRVKSHMQAKAALIMRQVLGLNVLVRSIWHVECIGPDGELKWVEDVHNITVNVGLDDILDKYFKGSTYTAAWYVGLKDTGTPVAADTMASHASWATITPYSNATDPAWTGGTVSSQSVDNSASPAVFNINATDEVFGAFLKTDNTKGGTSGTLYGVADFSASRNVANGDTLNVTATLTSASA